MINQFRTVVFPDDKHDDQRYLKKAREAFKKLSGMEFRITPGGGT